MVVEKKKKRGKSEAADPQPRGGGSRDHLLCDTMWRRRVGALLLRPRSPLPPPSSTLRRHLPDHQGSDGGNSRKPFIAFVLGGPGSGKGTQCARIASDYGFAHLSAGDLLRNEISSGTEKGELILDIIKQGKIVPSEITVELIRKAMESTDAKRVLIDGFPRCEENRIAFERITGTEPDLVVFFDCPEDEMVKRLLGRNQGRVDDNIETIKKRLKVFESLNIPVIDYYSSRGKVHKINATGTEQEIFGAVRKLFSSLRF
uniref:UMP-CMP kinase n=1 Tax=Leersia perrieri TaxID=77586 RepID=A0A0D9WUS8_9ORYZ